MVIDIDDLLKVLKISVLVFRRVSIFATGSGGWRSYRMELCDLQKLWLKMAVRFKLREGCMRFIYLLMLGLLRVSWGPRVGVVFWGGSLRDPKL